MSIDKYDPIRVLGEGSFGKVYLMRDKVNRGFVCVKVIKIKNIPKKEREATKVEVDLLRRLHHPNIVHYVDSFLSKNNEVLCICMEYCDGGDLASQIKAAKRNLFSESKILHWFVQMSLGLQYMHSNKVLHRDLKTQNVFMLGNGRLVLGDLGISKVLDGTMDFAQTCIGTPYYMSPEIFQNKPYSYKSDVWALGCVLYEMTTLNHAFDANSLNGLACKIVKGRYPPIHAKYSKFLRDLIGQMLLINPQQRPDLDQILRKPFIKKHILNFFTDIASRPSSSIGEGTMVMKVAAGGGGVVNSAIGKDSNVIALQRQLQELDMASAVADALAPKGAPVDPLEAKKMAKEQASALRREEDHKKMVEAALEKLRLERENRSKGPGGVQRGAGRPLASNPSSASVAAAGPSAPSRREEPVKPAAFRQPPQQQQQQQQQQPSAGAPLSRAPSQAGIVRDGGMGWGAKKPAEQKDQQADPDSARGDPRPGPRGRRSTFSEKEERDRKAAEERRQEDLLARERERERALEDRRREDVRLEARNREEARLREEARAKQEAAAKQRMDELRAQQEAASKREQQRDRERQRQKEEIEQLKKDKIELDRRAAERDRIREERQLEEQRQLEEARRGRGSFGGGGGGGGVISPQEKERDDPYAAAPPSYRSSSRAEEKESVSARDRVIMRRQEKQARDEQDRLEALREAEVDARVHRAAAAVQKRAQYDNSSVLPSAGPSHRGSFAHDAKDGYDEDSVSARNRNSNGRRAEPMDVDELAARLADATKGPSRYEPTSRSPEGSQPNTARRFADSAAPYPSARTPSILDDNSSEDDEEAEIFIKASKAQVPAVNAEIDEDLVRREEELRAELNLSTIRCQELKRTLQATKSFMGVTPNSGPDGRPGAAVPGQNGMGIGGMKPRPQPLVVEGSDDEEDDAYEFDESTEFEETWAEDDNFEYDAPLPKASAPRARSESKDTGEVGGGGGGGEITPRRERPAAVSARASPYQNLQDPPTPSGRLSDRIDRLRQKCVEALGQDAFEDAYRFLKEFEESHTSSAHGFYDDSAEEVKKMRMRAILGDAKAHYTSLIEQLLFMEETHCR